MSACPCPDRSIRSPSLVQRSSPNLFPEIFAKLAPKIAKLGSQKRRSTDPRIADEVLVAKVGPTVDTKSLSQIRCPNGRHSSCRSCSASSSLPNPSSTSGPQLVFQSIPVLRHRGISSSFVSSVFAVVKSVSFSQGWCPRRHSVSAAKQPPSGESIQTTSEGSEYPEHHIQLLYPAQHSVLIASTSSQTACECLLTEISAIDVTCFGVIAWFFAEKHSSSTILESLDVDRKSRLQIGDFRDAQLTAAVSR